MHGCGFVFARVYLVAKRTAASAPSGRACTLRSTSDTAIVMSVAVCGNTLTTKMGKVTFKSDQPTQSLSGTLGGVTYRVDAEGQTFAFIRSHSSVPVIDECIDEIQQQQILNHPTTPQQLADRRKALYMRIKRLYLRYKDHPQLIDNPDELRKAILLAYKQKRKR